ncbi:hypothetical protein HPB52_014089 [Rhipicephalus sanguineus]|uniref:Uncharacterized protein n=1 Tax=Rhipicephalus sanguineus TaxID=34632 RepID=A0A9D4YPX7_RHISA|nr:hypothetical protein HPB52_014089 [Rhipicephalus sanguineus]
MLELLASTRVHGDLLQRGLVLAARSAPLLSYQGPDTNQLPRLPPLESKLVPVLDGSIPGAGEDEQEPAKGATRMVMSCLRSVIREEAQALRLEFLRQTGITAGAGDMSSSGHHGSSSKAPKAKKDIAAGC